jgi:hypothetical protein
MMLLVIKLASYIDTFNSKPRIIAIYGTAIWAIRF